MTPYIFHNRNGYSCIITNKYLVEVVVGLQIVQDVEYFL